MLHLRFVVVLQIGNVYFRQFDAGVTLASLKFSQFN